MIKWVKPWQRKYFPAIPGGTSSAGEITIAKVDLCLLQDGTGPLTIRQVEKLGATKLANPRSDRFLSGSRIAGLRARSWPTTTCSFATLPRKPALS